MFLALTIFVLATQSCKGWYNTQDLTKSRSVQKRIIIHLTQLEHVIESCFSPLNIHDILGLVKYFVVTNLSCVCVRFVRFLGVYSHRGHQHFALLVITNLENTKIQDPI